MTTEERWQDTINRYLEAYGVAYSPRVNVADFLTEALAAVRAEAQREERERCAKICEAYMEDRENPLSLDEEYVAICIAERIRALPEPGGRT